MSRIVTTYPYCDEFGEVLYEAVRMEPKDFRQRRPDGNGWLWNLEGVRRVLYQLPDLIASRYQEPGAWVWIAEGEKDADNLRLLGFTATTNVGGAKSWQDEYGAFLTGRKCVILEDNDQAGRERVRTIAGSLVYHGASAFRVMRFPTLAEGGDLSDWLAQLPRHLTPHQRAEALGSMLGKCGVWWFR